MAIGTIGLIASALGSVAGGVGSAMSNKKRQAELNKAKTTADNYYLSQINQDPTKRADNAAMLAQLRRRLDAQNNRNKAVNKITGATQEQVIAQQGNAANAYADSVSKMQALHAQRQDLLAKEKMQNDLNYSSQQADIAAARQQAWGNLAANAVELGSAAIGTIGGEDSKAVTQNSN